MKKLLLIVLALTAATAWGASQQYYSFPDARKMYDNDRMLVFQNASGSRNYTGAGLKKEVLTFPNISGSQTVKGNLIFSGTGRRITGDFTTGTDANRLSLQSSTTNGQSIVNIIPNGTSTVAAVVAFAGSDVANAPYLNLIANGVNSTQTIQATRKGTGSWWPLRLMADNAVALYITASGTSTAGTNPLVLIRGTSTTDTVTPLQVTGAIKSTVYTVATLPAGTAGVRSFVSDSNATTFGAIVAGGGANFVPVYHDGTNWRIG